MEDHRESLPPMQSRHISIRTARALPQLNSFDESTNPHLLEAGERAGDSEGLLVYWRTLVRHKTAILAASFAGLLLGILVGIPMKPVFRSNTMLEVLTLNQDFMNMRGSQAEVPGADSDNLSEEETEATLLQSSELLNRVSASLNPNPTPPNRSAPQGWRRLLHFGAGPKPSDREKLLGAAVHTLKVTNPPRTRLLNISVDSTDPQLALEFTNGLVQEFIKQNVDARRASTLQTGEWLSHEINDARANLQKSEDALQSYASSSKLFFTDDQKQTSVATQKLEEIQQQLSAATSDRIAKQSAFELATKSPPDTLADVLNDASLQALSARLDDATRQVASLSAIYNPGYAKLQQAEAELISVREAFTSRRGDLLHRIETDYESAKRRETLLSSSYDTQAREVAGQDERAVQYNILKREVDSSRQLYDTMLQQMKQASIATALGASNVHVVYPAYLLDRPVFPNFKMNAALGLFAGFLASAGFIFIRNQTDRTLRQPGEVKLWASLPELGAIPRLRSSATKSNRGFLPRQVRVQWSTDNAKSLMAEERYDWLNLADPSDRPIAIPEAFHSTLTSILHAGRFEGGRVLVFTSAGPADGKTSVVSNIAIAAAAIGKKVLLVDADLRRPRLHDLFGLKNEAGLADLLRADGDWARWPALTQRTKMPGLNVITAGEPRQGAGILFYSPGFSRLLTKWKEEYDLVLLDSPPALPITDARVMGFLSDGVVLVTRAGQTTRDELLAIQERFAEDRIPLVGCILNDWDPSHSGRNYPYFDSEEPAALKYSA
jgi:capsular exopolysaccharide synthesis family protein